MNSCGLLAFLGMATEIHYCLLLVPYFLITEFLSIYRVPFPRNGLEALLVSIYTGQVKAVPQQQPIFSHCKV